MDKVIIDGVDVSECKYNKGYCRISALCDYSGHICEVDHDCYYKQLQRLKAENERLKEENEQLKKSIDRIMQNKEIKTIDLDIAKENVELKAENDRLKEENEHYRKEAYRLADGLNKTENLAFTYKQALQEIREIVDCAKCEYESNDNCNPQQCSKIETKINEVIGAVDDRQNKLFQIKNR